MAGPGRAPGCARARLGGEGLEQEHLLAEGDERGLLALAEAVQEGPRRILQRVQLGAPDAAAHVEDEHRVDRRLLLEDGLQLLHAPVVPDLEVGRAQASDGRALARDEHLDPDEAHLRPEDRRLLRGGDDEQGGGEEGAHRSSAFVQIASRAASARPGGPKG